MPSALALISVSNKAGLIDLAKGLNDLGISILSTGGTAALLRKHSVDATDVSEHTGFPEIMDGRVKTLHPRIHAGLLARGETDQAVLDEHGIKPISLLIANLYPFAEVTENSDCDLATAIEHIDIGGPTMLRAAAKNHEHVTVIVDPEDYGMVLEELQSKGDTSPETRRHLAEKVFVHTAQYDTTIASYLKGEAVIPGFVKQSSLRYGENPHQEAAFYVQPSAAEGSVSKAQQHQGKALSFNNIMDADAALNCVKLFDSTACVIVKHANPCGVALADTPKEAYLKAFESDSVSSFGGIIAFNTSLDEETAALILEKQFVEIVIAPEVSDAALKALAKKPNVRVLSTGAWPEEPSKQLEFKTINGGLLVQEQDNFATDSSRFETVTQKAPTEAEHQDLLFAWEVAKCVKSNAIVLAHEQTTCGIGAGQTNRVGSCQIACENAKAIKHKVMASDGFFPFADNIEMAAQHGITAIIQPGGSIRDQAVIEAADAANIAMILTHIRHFKH